MTKHEWSEWHETPNDAPKNKDERLLVKVLNGIACAIFIPAMFAGWIACGFAAPNEGAPVLSQMQAAPYETIMILGSAILFPLAIVALLLANRGK
jgi:hypothetical protein